MSYSVLNRGIVRRGAFGVTVDVPGESADDRTISGCRNDGGTWSYSQDTCACPKIEYPTGSGNWYSQFWHDASANCSEYSPTPWGEGEPSEDMMVPTSPPSGSKAPTGSKTPSGFKTPSARTGSSTSTATDPDWNKYAMYGAAAVGGGILLMLLF